VISGVGAGAAGLSPVWTALLCGLVSVAFVGLGDRVASGIAVLLSPSRARLLSGLLLISAGAVQLFL
jgi:hypothetical protein